MIGAVSYGHLRFRVDFHELYDQIEDLCEQLNRTFLFEGYKQTEHFQKQAEMEKAIMERCFTIYARVHNLADSFNSLLGNKTYSHAKGTLIRNPRQLGLAIGTAVVGGLIGSAWTGLSSLFMGSRTDPAMTHEIEDNRMLANLNRRAITQIKELIKDAFKSRQILSRYLATITHLGTLSGEVDKLANGLAQLHGGHLGPELIDANYLKEAVRELEAVLETKDYSLAVETPHQAYQYPCSYVALTTP